ncbi:hypothetical protein IIA79_04500 [bacterium]|nr:hypothetical protein [bacterium]
MILALCRSGLSYAEARAVGMEEMLCLLAHARIEETLRELGAESARVASQSFADPEEQRRALTSLKHRANAELDRFYQSRL